MVGALVTAYLIVGGPAGSSTALCANGIREPWLSAEMCCDNRCFTCGVARCSQHKVPRGSRPDLSVLSPAERSVQCCLIYEQGPDGVWLRGPASIIAYRRTRGRSPLCQDELDVMCLTRAGAAFDAQLNGTDGAATLLTRKGDYAPSPREQARLQQLAQHAAQYWRDPHMRTVLERAKACILVDSDANSSSSSALGAVERNSYAQGPPGAACGWDCYRRATMLEPLVASVLHHGVPGEAESPVAWP